MIKLVKILSEIRVIRGAVTVEMVRKLSGKIQDELFHDSNIDSNIELRNKYFEILRKYIKGANTYIVKTENLSQNELNILYSELTTLAKEANILNEIKIIKGGVNLQTMKDLFYKVRDKINDDYHMDKPYEDLSSEFKNIQDKYRSGKYEPIKPHLLTQEQINLFFNDLVILAKKYNIQ